MLSNVHPVHVCTTTCASPHVYGTCAACTQVEAYSVQHAYRGEWSPSEPKLTSVPLRPDLPPMPAWAPEVIFTYDSVWEHSDIAWASRWDLYLYMGDDQVHWFSILNSLVIVFLLSGIVAMIMVRTLRRDLAEYNSVEEKEEAGGTGYQCTGNGQEVCRCSRLRIRTALCNDVSLSLLSSTERYRAPVGRLVHCLHARRHVLHVAHQDRVQ